MEGSSENNDHHVVKSSVKDGVVLEEVHVRWKNALGMSIIKREYVEIAGEGGVEVKTDVRKM